MTAKHTPGPWKVIGTVIEGPEYPISRVYSATSNNEDILPIGPFEEAANARLIAAAPDLLAALEAVSNSRKIVILGPAIVRQVRAAIRKAEGL